MTNFVLLGLNRQDMIYHPLHMLTLKLHLVGITHGLTCKTEQKEYIKLEEWKGTW